MPKKRKPKTLLWNLLIIAGVLVIANFVLPPIWDKANARNEQRTTNALNLMGTVQTTESRLVSDPDD